MEINSTKCQYMIEEDVYFACKGIPENTKLVIRHLGEIIKEHDISSENIINLGKFPVGGYHVQAGDAYTAFDVVENSADYIRYGFLSDFGKEDVSDEDDVCQLNKYHITAVQFYDWMYRHHKLIPDSVDYVDPLGRKLNLDAVKNKIELCHKHGMKAIAYGAVYGAEKEYFEKFPEQLLYKNSGEKLDLIDIIGIMNIRSDGPWASHITNEFRTAVSELDFDGIHMDQYGFPKTAVEWGSGQSIDLRNEFTPLINKTKYLLTEVKNDNLVIFNCVNNWPVEYVADSEQDAVYIEVWDPHSRYRDLNALVREALFITGKRKNVILSAYVHPFNENIEDFRKEYSALLTMSVIFASGGNHLLLGEKNGALAEAYYVNHGKYTEEFSNKLKSYYDFIVAYEEYLFGKSLHDITRTYAGGINDEISLDVKISTDFSADTLSVVVKELKDCKIINLVNLVGIESDIWNEGKIKPVKQKDIVCKVLLQKEVKGVYVASPDDRSGMPLKLKHSYVNHSQGQAIEFIIPEIDVWSMVFIKL